MALFSSSSPSIRARVLPRFPAQVLAGNGLTISRAGGSYIFELKPYSEIPLSGLATMPPNTLVGRDGPGPAPPGAITVGGGLSFTGAGGLELSHNQRGRSSISQFSPPVANGFWDIVVPLACSIVQVTLLGDPTGSVVIDLRKSSFSTFPPVAGNSICATAKPTIVTGVKFQDSTLTGWNRSVLAGDVLRVFVESVTAFTRLSVCLDVETV